MIITYQISHKSHKTFQFNNKNYKNNLIFIKMNNFNFLMINRQLQQHLIIIAKIMNTYQIIKIDNKVLVFKIIIYYNLIKF